MSGQMPDHALEEGDPRWCEPHTHDWHMLEWVEGYLDKRPTDRDGEKVSSWIAIKFICLSCKKVEEVE